MPTAMTKGTVSEHGFGAVVSIGMDRYNPHTIIYSWKTFRFLKVSDLAVFFA